MKLKRVESITESRGVQDIKVVVEDKNNMAHSQVTLSNLFRTQQRVPNVLKSSLRSKAAGRQENEQREMKLSKVGSMINSIIKSSSTKWVCEICETQITKPANKDLEVFMCQQHKQNFCESCLHHYVIYKVKAFEEVHCPHEGCPGMLDMNSKFFKQLPIDVQKAYRKVTQFYLVSKNPNMKMCPKQNCEGILQTTAENIMVCDSCKKAYCGKCLLAVHMGECDTQELHFFQSNLHYRQCKKCKFIIEKNQGCNHMTCRCGNQFCYVCGQDWDPAHYGNHDQNGRLVPEAIQAAQANNEQNESCCLCACLGGCICLILNILLKFLLFIGFILLMLCIFIIKDVSIMAGLAIMCIFTGMFGYSFEIVSDARDLKCILAVIFFPITMLLGMVMAFRQLFCQHASDCLRLTREICDNIWRALCQL